MSHLGTRRRFGEEQLPPYPAPDRTATGEEIEVKRTCRYVTMSRVLKAANSSSGRTNVNR